MSTHHYELRMPTEHSVITRVAAELGAPPGWTPERMPLLFEDSAAAVREAYIKGEPK